MAYPSAPSGLRTFSMPTRYIRRAADLGTSTSRANANPIFVDSDDDQLKFATGASGTTTVDIVTESQTQTLTNKTLTSPTLTAPALGAATATSVAATGALTSSGATAGIGYATGAGGTVTQATSKSTGVTLNTATGLITMNGAALAADAIVSFTLTNSAIAATDMVLLQHDSVATVGAYVFSAQPAAGSAVINVANRTAGSLSEAIVIRFAVLKSVSA